MIFEESYGSNHLKDMHNGEAVEEQEDSDSERENQGYYNEEDNTNAELFVRLTDMVRKHYCGYLEKQLLENVQVWRANINEENDNHTESTAESAALQECCRLLEDRALKACMHARRYQRTMLKIIAEVRRNTQEFRLEEELKKLLSIDKKSVNSIQCSYSQKSTQTEESSFCMDVKPRRLASDSESNIKHSPCSLTLQQKIEMFQKRLNQETAAIVAATHKKQRYAKTRRNSSHNHMNEKPHVRRRQKHNADSKISRYVERYEKSDNTTMPTSRCISSIPVTQNTIEETENASALDDVFDEIKNTEKTHAAAINTSVRLNASAESDTLESKCFNTLCLEQDDEIAKELDQLFSEEKSELEELLGLTTNTEIDDPQVRSVLEEIEKAPLSHELKPTTAAGVSCADVVYSPPIKLQQTSLSIPNGEPQMLSSPIINLPENLNSEHHHTLVEYSEQPISDLKHSLWPCELYMQRRRLTASLSRLIEEDFRWQDIIKWKFQTLFGEDSDDEFAACSPSIELDDVLMNSCIRRISPWIVKHLMKPMRDGLIANRFLFKKLAKRLAQSIVLENQYPDERLIKCVVEEYFCLHQAVLSLEDMNEMPNLKSIDNT